ncbi:MAG: transposase [Spirochaetaceae bacterium]|jgi:putative transposase|nr:transposase [Spirochaetaceae bacterium]
MKTDESAREREKRTGQQEKISFKIKANRTLGVVFIADRRQAVRKPRRLKRNAVYHVTAKVNRGENIFFCSAMRQLFLFTLKRARKKYSFTVHHFRIMSNHIHLIIQPGPDENLSRIMQWVLGVFARAWNKAHGIKGHVWGDRFFSKILDGLREFFRAFATKNPFKVQLVKSAEEWEFGGLWHFITGNLTYLS